ncbi:hypothetical protein OA492_02835 [Pelagibacteraceae bacterium]|nr:hypothetical protein [Pelagibacteraceae bacterium]
MKTLITFFVLLFSSPVFADDISDFQIEGISIGDSALDSFSKTDLNNAYDIFDYKKNKFRYYFLPYEKAKTYDFLQITIKPDDKNFLIYGLQGHIMFRDINECYSKMKEIRINLENVFNIKGIEDSGSHYMDPSGNSTYLRYMFYLSYDDTAEIVCYDMSNKLEKEGREDRLAITLSKREFIDFINENY